MLFFFNDTATTEIYTLSLHDALPISGPKDRLAEPPHAEQDQQDADQELKGAERDALQRRPERQRERGQEERSEEHTSELQSRLHLVCRLLLEKKKNNKSDITTLPRQS